MTKHPSNVVSISSYRPRTESRAVPSVSPEAVTRRRRGVAALAGIALVASGAAGTLMYKGNESFKHDQRMDVLEKVEKTKSGAGEELYLVVHSGATLRRTPMIPGRTSSPNHAEPQKDNVDSVVPEGQALFMRGVLTQEDDAGVVWYGAEVVPDMDNIEHQNPDELGDHIVWISSELSEQKQPDGSAYIESRGSGEPVDAHIEGGHFVVSDGRPFATAQLVDTQAAQRALIPYNEA
ncbi:MAG: hypothetical protein ABIQ89_03605 [Candidatus Saccharimonadales bacterium]